jgi:hypothetical protein
MNKVIEFFNKKWGEYKVCPVCKQTDWIIFERLYEVREYHEEGMVLAGGIIPFIVVSCTTCGNTRFFNAIVAGVVKSREKEVENG